MNTQEYCWESPGLIYVPHALNNRDLNHDYVDTLELSMRNDGFLPTYPIVVFRSLDLPYFDSFTEKLGETLICACGAHRTTAAKNAGLEKVYVEIRSGNMDDFFEAMHTDNFQFDAEHNSELGQLFTKKEKREACQSMLTLPKYLKLTNVALAELWHTSESNIRRWRDEVVKILKEGSDKFQWGFFPEGRKAEIEAILNSDVRETETGEAVKVRSKPNRPDRWDFYWEVKARFNEVALGTGMPRTIDDAPLTWYPDVYAYCVAVYDHKDPDSLSLQKLGEIDVLINTKDKEFFERCRDLGKTYRKLKAAQAECHKAYTEAKDAFVVLLRGQGFIESTYSEDYQKLLKGFEKVVSRTFGLNLIGSQFYTGEVHKYMHQTEQLNQLRRDIESNAEYVDKFLQRTFRREQKKRMEIEKAVIASHHEMLKTVKEKYPTIDLYKFALMVDHRSWRVDVGMTPAYPMMSADISEERTTGELDEILEHYGEIIKDIHVGADWIEKVVKASEEVSIVPPQDADLDNLLQVIVTYRIDEHANWDKQIFEKDPPSNVDDISDLPESIRKQLLSFLMGEE